MSIQFTVNGKRIDVTAAPMERLLDVLREQLGLTGTKEGCGEGECGSCTVLLDGEPVCSCLVPMLQVAGKEITTIEGIGGSTQLSPVQQAMVERGGVQCGACTPGVVLSAEALLEDDPTPNRGEIREALAGNLCRCTGYRRIFEAVEEAAEKKGQSA